MTRVEDETCRLHYLVPFLRNESRKVGKMILKLAVKKFKIPKIEFHEPRDSSLHKHRTCRGAMLTVCHVLELRIALRVDDIHV